MGEHVPGPVAAGDAGEVSERAATLAGLAAADRAHAEDWTCFRLWCGDLERAALRRTR